MNSPTSSVIPLFVPVDKDELGDIISISNQAFISHGISVNLPTMASSSYGDVDESPYSSYEFGEYSSSYHLGNPNPIDYASSAYYKHHYSPPINYTSSYDYYSEPQFLQYEPPPHYQGYFPKFTISYSNVEFNEPEFEEYDPTPYDGGYDQRMTYGKPLPPSDLTCYPRSLPQSHTPLEDFSYNSIPSPYGKDDDIPIHPPQKIKPAAEPESKVISDEIVEPTNVIDSPSYDHGRGGDYVPQVSYGSGLEAIDLCESIFGYWPCLAKKAQQQRNSCQVCDQDTRMDPWQTAADYFFGSPMPYDYHNYHHHQSDQVQ